MKHEWSAAVRSAMEDIDASTPAPPPFRRIASAHSESVRRSRRHVGGYAVVLGLATATLLVVVLNSGDEKKVLAPTQTTTPTEHGSAHRLAGIHFRHPERTQRSRSTAANHLPGLRRGRHSMVQLSRRLRRLSPRPRRCGPIGRDRT